MTHTDPAHTAARNTHRFAVIGGDGRMTHLAERLSEAGYGVRLLGCGTDCLPIRESEGEIRMTTTLQGATEGVDTLILPLPTTRDGVTVHCPRDPSCTVTLREIAELLARHPHMQVFGGKLPTDLKASLPPDRVTDYYESEVLQLRNAYITAEAALMTAMELLDRTLRDTSVAVLGFGRIGKYLARLLHAMGATVTVCARREESLFEAAAEGGHPLLITGGTPMNGLHPLTRNHTVIFNTVPSPILNRELLLSMEENTLLIDLASAPFGVCDGDVREASTKNGLRYLRAPSLPGSYAPRDAGRIIAECILNELSQKEKTTTEKGGKQA